MPSLESSHLLLPTSLSFRPFQWEQDLCQLLPPEPGLCPLPVLLSLPIPSALTYLIQSFLRVLMPSDHISQHGSAFSHLRLHPKLTPRPSLPCPVVPEKVNCATIVLAGLIVLPPNQCSHLNTSHPDLMSAQLSPQVIVHMVSASGQMQVSLFLSATVSTWGDSLLPCPALPSPWPTPVFPEGRVCYISLLSSAET